MHLAGRIREGADLSMLINTSISSLWQLNDANWGTATHPSSQKSCFSIWLIAVISSLTSLWNSSTRRWFTAAAAAAAGPSGPEHLSLSVLAPVLTLEHELLQNKVFLISLLFSAHILSPLFLNTTYKCFGFRDPATSAVLSVRTTWSMLVGHVNEDSRVRSTISTQMLSCWHFPKYNQPRW